MSTQTYGDLRVDCECVCAQLVFSQYIYISNQGWPREVITPVCNKMEDQEGQCPLFHSLSPKQSNHTACLVQKLTSRSQHHSLGFDSVRMFILIDAWRIKVSDRYDFGIKFKIQGKIVLIFCSAKIMEYQHSKSP